MGESVNTSGVSVLVSFEPVTSLQDLMLVGYNVLSLIDKTSRTSSVLVVKKPKSNTFRTGNGSNSTISGISGSCVIFVAHITMFRSFF